MGGGRAAVVNRPRNAARVFGEGYGVRAHQPSQVRVSTMPAMLIGDAGAGAGRKDKKVLNALVFNLDDHFKVHSSRGKCSRRLQKRI